MKLLIYFIFFFFVLKVHAQNDTTTTLKKRKKFSVGISYEPKVCFRTASNNEAYIWPANNDQPMIGYYYYYTNKNFETYKYGYTIGVDISYLPRNFLAINTGVKYSTMGYKTQVVDTLYVGYTGWPGKEDTPLFNSKIDYSYIYWQMPLTVSYIIPLKKIHFTAGVGVTFNRPILAQANFNGSEWSDAIENIYDLRKRDFLYYSGQVGIKYDINYCISLGLHSSFNYQRFALDKHRKLHLYSYGLITNINFNF